MLAYFEESYLLRFDLVAVLLDLPQPELESPQVPLLLLFSVTLLSLPLLYLLLSHLLPVCRGIHVEVPRAALLCDCFLTSEGRLSFSVCHCNCFVTRDLAVVGGHIDLVSLSFPVDLLELGLLLLV